MTRATWTSALIGFLVSASAPLLFFAAMYLAAGSLASELPIELREHQASGLRRSALEDARFFCIFLVGYWFISALLGRGRVAAARLPNFALAIAGTIALFWSANGFFWWMDSYCDQYPQSHTAFSLAKIAECPSSEIALAGSYIAVSLLVLFSLAGRIMRSRRRALLTS